MTTHTERVAEDMIREARMLERVMLGYAIHRDRSRGEFLDAYDKGQVRERREHARSLRRFAADLLDDYDDGLLGRAYLAEYRRQREAA
jgi:hypothetical protein